MPSRKKMDLEKGTDFPFPFVFCSCFLIMLEFFQEGAYPVFHESDFQSYL